MRMTRKMLIGAVVLAGLCVGQGCPGTQPAPGRLDVTDRLRAACSRLTDIEIDKLITDTESDRVKGVPKHELVSAINQACIGRGNECSVCGVTIIDQVYGE